MEPVVVNEMYRGLVDIGRLVVTFLFYSTLLYSTLNAFEFLYTPPTSIHH